MRVGLYLALSAYTNVIVGEFGQYGSSDRILDSLPRFRSTTRYDDTITLTLGYIFVYTLFFLFLNFGSRSLPAIRRKTIAVVVRPQPAGAQGHTQKITLMPPAPTVVV
jgi:hypothetical protein